MVNPVLRKHLLATFTTICSAIAFVAILAWYAVKPIYQKNGFDREFENIRIQTKDIALKSPYLWNLAGRDKTGLYFQALTATELTKYSPNLRTKSVINIPIPANSTINSNFEFMLKSDSLWLFAKNVPLIYRINLKENRVEQFKVPKSIFTRAVQISGDNLIFRRINDSMNRRNQIFSKGNIISQSEQKEQNLSENIDDIGISTDGLLHFDPKTSSIIYVYFYKNGFMSFDTNLVKKNEFHTIDTFYTALTKGGSMSKNGETTITNIFPSRRVNIFSNIHNGRLYNFSNIKADNESIDAYNSNNPIDIYSTENGEYLGTFYLPNYQGERLLQFKIYDDMIVAIYKSHIVTYSYAYLPD